MKFEFKICYKFKNCINFEKSYIFMHMLYHQNINFGSNFLKFSIFPELKNNRTNIWYNRF